MFSAEKRDSEPNRQPDEERSFGQAERSACESIGGPQARGVKAALQDPPRQAHRDGTGNPQDRSGDELTHPDSRSPGPKRRHLLSCGRAEKASRGDARDQRRDREDLSYHPEPSSSGEGQGENHQGCEVDGCQWAPLSKREAEGIGPSRSGDGKCKRSAAAGRLAEVPAPRESRETGASFANR